MPFTPDTRSLRHSSNLQRWDSPSRNFQQHPQLPFSSQTAVGFGGIEDSNDSFVLNFPASPSGAQAAAAAMASPAIPAPPSFDDSETSLMDWEATALNESRPAQPAFRSSPSEPFYFGRRAPAAPSASSRLTAVASAPPPMPMPPPTSEPRRSSIKRPSTAVAAPSTVAAEFTDDEGETDQPLAGEDTENRMVSRRSSSSKRDQSVRGTPKRRKVTGNSCATSAGRPLGDLTNSSSTSSSSNLSTVDVSGKKQPPMLHRCLSEMTCGSNGNHSNASCSSAAAALDSVRVDRAIASIDSLNLIGNSEQQHSLPTVQELNYGIRHVTGATVSRLVNGGFASTVPNYVIIDCRYPYEFEGGHILGAVNIYTQDELLERIFNPARSFGSAEVAGSSRPQVLIFHCEFSSERAPKLARFLRQRDREANAINYPELHFPEVYVLQGGYKAFFEAYKADCQPSRYVRMADPGYKAQLAQFQRAGKAWERQNSRSRHSQLERMAADRLLF